MSQSNISFVLFSYNEEQRIEYVLRNLVPFGQVYVLDAGSTDRTQEITERLGAKFVIRPKSDAFYLETEEMMDFVKPLITTEWIFWSMVDNLLPRPLLEKMTEISQQDTYKYVYVPIDTYMWGETNHAVISASYPNFFHKDFVTFKGNRMHGMGTFTGNKDQILHIPKKKEFSIRHYSLYDVNKFVSKHLTYALHEAEDKIQHGRKFSITYLLGSMANYFRLFYRRGFRAGAVGLFVALLYSFFRLMVSVRLYEIEKGVTLEGMEKEFQKDKKKILAEIEKGV